MAAPPGQMIAAISTGWLIAGFFGGILVFFLVLGKLTRGSGADLVDWDPIGRAEERRINDYEDLRQLLALENQGRRERGLPALTEEDVYRGALGDEDGADDHEGRR